MSGFEVLGAILGILSLAEPAEGLCKSIISVTQPSKNSIEFIGEVQRRISVCRRSFVTLTEKLLAQTKLDDTDKVLLLAELKGGKSCEDGELDQRLRTEFENTLGRSAESICNVLYLVQKEFTHLKRILEKLALPKQPQPSSQGDKHNSVKATTKLKISKKKAQINEKLNSLRALIMTDYKAEVKEYIEATTAHSSSSLTIRQSSARSNQRFSNIDVQQILTSMENYHRILKRLFATLQSTANCHCHGLHLCLNFDLTSGKGSYGSRSRFSENYIATFGMLFVSSKSASNENATVLGSGDNRGAIDAIFPLKIKSRKYILPNRVNSAASISMGRLTAEPPGASPSIPSTTGPPKIKKSVKWSFNTVQHQVTSIKRKIVSCADIPKKHPQLRTSNAGAADLDPPESPTVVADEDTAEATPIEIQDLCQCLSSFGGGITPQSPDDGGYSSTDCLLGYLHDRDDFKHMIYRMRNHPNVASASHHRTTLHSILSSHSKQDRPTVFDRVTMAYHLALSLLQLHSSPWIKRDWRAWDVLLYRNDDEDTDWSPYVEAAFNDLRSLQETQIQSARTNIGRKQIFKPSYIYSLGIVLLELGRCEPLSTDPLSDEVLEWQLVSQAVKRTHVEKEMGPIYKNVVDKCVYWSRTRPNDDLQDHDVQLEFYKDVIVELERCLLPRY